MNDETKKNKGFKKPLIIICTLLVIAAAIWSAMTIKVKYEEHIETQTSAIEEGVESVIKVEEEVAEVKSSADIAHETRSKALNEHSEKEDILTKEKDETKKMEEELKKLKETK